MNIKDAQNRKYIFAAAAALATLFFAIGCILVDYFVISRSKAGILFWIGLTLTIASTLFATYTFILPLINALHIIHAAAEDTDSPKRFRAWHGKNKLPDQILEMIERMNRQKEQEYSLVILKKQAELNALQSQINPHFLYNTLDSILSLIHIWYVFRDGFGRTSQADRECHQQRRRRDRARAD